MKDYGEQYVGGAEAGDNQADECCDSPEEHLQIAILVICDCECLAETEDGGDQHDQCEAAGEKQEHKILFCHAEIYEYAFCGPNPGGGGMTGGPALAAPGVADEISRAYIVIPMEVFSCLHPR